MHFGKVKSDLDSYYLIRFSAQIGLYFIVEGLRCIDFEDFLTVRQKLINEHNYDSASILEDIYLDDEFL